MSSRPSLPDDAALAEVAEALAQTRQAATLFDHEWRLVWVSEDLKVLIGEEDEGKLGYGKHAIEAYLTDTWATKITPESQIKSFVVSLPWMTHDTPGGKERVKELLRRGMQYFSAEGWPEGFDPGDPLDAIIESLEPAPAPLVASMEIEFLRADLPPTPIIEMQFRLHDAHGRFVGSALVYDSALPARVIDLLARGDERMLERMVRLFYPGRRRAAILFADIQASTGLSRRLPSAAYFELIRGFTTAVDEVVVDHEGIVGKHAGDGVTAYFLADDLGSSSRAARAAIQAGRAIAAAVGVIASDLEEQTGVIRPEDCLVNVGLHWSGTLYMGQLITGGRLEVTALGDEVNECARIQESARDGQVFASKSLVEHLEPGDADSLGIDPDAVRYTIVADLEGATDKAKRDAGGIAVTPV